MIERLERIYAGGVGEWCGKKVRGWTLQSRWRVDRSYVSGAACQGGQGDDVMVWGRENTWRMGEYLKITERENTWRMG
ncbi:hypothetical protein EB118_17650, partial [bacterium]|nr:hypothetical protein [bacterium]NDG31884.1 hypothetical protein [bacterium]